MTIGWHQTGSSSAAISPTSSRPPFPSARFCDHHDPSSLSFAPRVQRPWPSCPITSRISPCHSAHHVSDSAGIRSLLAASFHIFLRLPPHLTSLIAATSNLNVRFLAVPHRMFARCQRFIVDPNVSQSVSVLPFSCSSLVASAATAKTRPVAYRAVVPRRAEANAHNRTGRARGSPTLSCTRLSSRASRSWSPMQRCLRRRHLHTMAARPSPTRPRNLPWTTGALPFRSHDRDRPSFLPTRLPHQARGHGEGRLIRNAPCKLDRMLTDRCSPDNSATSRVLDSRT